MNFWTREPESLGGEEAEVEEGQCQEGGKRGRMQGVGEWEVDWGVGKQMCILYYLVFSGSGF